MRLPIECCTIVHMPRAPVNRPRASGPERRTEILDAALKLIARQGLASVTHRSVAAAAGVPLGSTTYYFDSRDHLLGEAFRRYLALVSEELDAAAAELKRRPSLEALLDFLVRFTEREVEDEAVLLLEYELVLFAARDGALADDLHAWQDGMVADLAEALEALGARRPFDAARAVIQLVRGHELEQLTRREPRSEALRRRVELLLGACLEDA